MPLFKPKPSILVLPVTYKCNCRCLMCSIWMKQERIKDIPLHIFEKTFTSPILSSLKEVQITGGEPVLREDLQDIVGLVIEKCKKLKRLSLASNGIATEMVMNAVSAILEKIPQNVGFYVSLSLDGLKDTHGLIRGKEGAFENVMLTARELKKRFGANPNFKIGFNCVLSSFNYGQAEEILEFCRKEEISVGFTMANTVSAYIESDKCHSGFALTKEQLREVREFFLRLNERWPTPYFEMMDEMLGGAKRKLACYARARGILIDVDGSVYPCGQSVDLKYGNIYEEDIDRIWQKRISQKAREAFRRECQKCTTNCYPPDQAAWKRFIKQFLRP